ncbi:hypothetical protein [Campylobacter avium]|uniref:hypothetical protein n=1 Tax=Campylobacter avium TaxID=522485 RepID=UPI00248B6555|nr:hypothetical protein [Campylobacter avium]
MNYFNYYKYIAKKARLKVFLFSARIALKYIISYPLLVVVYLLILLLGLLISRDMFETEAFKEIKQGLNIVDFFRMLTEDFYLEYKCQKCGKISGFSTNKKKLEAKRDNANLEFFWYDPKQKLCFICYKEKEKEQN